jgi:hypothetical protein
MSSFHVAWYALAFGFAIIALSITLADGAKHNPQTIENQTDKTNKAKFVMGVVSWVAINLLVITYILQTTKGLQNAFDDFTFLMMVYVGMTLLGAFSFVSAPTIPSVDGTEWMSSFSLFCVIIVTCLQGLLFVFHLAKVLK